MDYPESKAAKKYDKGIKISRELEINVQRFGVTGRRSGMCRKINRRMKVTSDVEQEGKQLESEHGQ